MYNDNILTKNFDKIMWIMSIINGFLIKFFIGIRNRFGTFWTNSQQLYLTFICLIEMNLELY